MIKVITCCVAATLAHCNFLSGRLLRPQSQGAIAGRSTPVKFCKISFPDGVAPRNCTSQLRGARPQKFLVWTGSQFLVYSPINLECLILPACLFRVDFQSPPVSLAPLSLFCPSCYVERREDKERYDFLAIRCYAISVSS